MVDPAQNAETFRLKAIALLSLKDVELARLEILKALELRPRWDNVRFTAAMIDYYSSLAPAAIPDQPSDWPEPPNWMLVKRDDESVDRFRRAAEVFASLIAKEPVDQTTTSGLQVWRLGCLANDAERQDEASNYCEQILRDSPENYRAVAWATARNLRTDIESSIAVLSEKAAAGLASPQEIAVLAGVYLSRQRIADAIDLLDGTRGVFEREGAEQLWKTWHHQALALKGEAPESILAVDEPDTVRRSHLTALVLRTQSQVTGDWKPLISHLMESYAETSNAAFLFEACDVLGVQGEWATVASHAAKLVAEVSTADALTLAAVALFNTNQPKACLELVDRNRSLFRHSKLPNQLQRIEMLCQRQLGALPEAVSRAEQIAREEPTTANILSLAQLYLEKGDMKGLAIVARRLEKREDLRSGNAIQIANFIQSEDKELARSLWRSAVGRGVDDDAIGSAVSLAFELGLDNEAASLLERMTKLGSEGRGGIQLATIDDMVSMAKERQKAGEHLNDVYRKGQAPVHIVPAAAGVPLAKLYHATLATNENDPDPTRQLALMIRHGGRDITDDGIEIDNEPRITADLTAVLLMAHLDVTTEVLSSFKPLMISADVPRALLEMRGNLSPKQPEQLKSLQEILSLLDRKLLEVSSPTIDDAEIDPVIARELGVSWAGNFASIQGQKGYVLDFLPLRRNDGSLSEAVVPETVLKSVASCRGVLEALRLYGPLSDEQYRTALKAIGSEQHSPTGSIPELNSIVICLANTPEVLAQAGLLEIASKRFTVLIESDEVTRARREMQDAQDREALANWVDQVLERVTKAIDSGDIKLWPAKSADGDDLRNGMSYRCLEALLAFEGTPRDVIWTDDRYLNGFVRRDTVPIVGVLEVLRSLAKRGALSNDQYYEKLLRLRAANARFLPLTTDEIVYHLSQARVEGRTVVVTHSLTVLAGYIAACLADAPILQRPPVPEGASNSQGEMGFLLGLIRTIVETIAALWRTGSESTEVTARADWVLSNLFVNHSGVAEVATPGSQAYDPRYLASMTIASLLSQGIRFGSGKDGEGRNRRRAYYRWLTHRFLERQFAADDQIASSVAGILKRTLVDVLVEAKSQPQYHPVAIQLVRQLYEDLPQQVRTELWRDSEFMAAIGSKPLVAVTIGRWNFNPQDFYKAAAAAVNGATCEIQPLDSDAKVTAAPRQNDLGRVVVSLTSIQNATTVDIDSDDLEVLGESPSKREAVLRSHPEWLDGGNEFESGIAEIASIDDPGRRMEKLAELRAASAADQYVVLRDKFKNDWEFNPSELAPRDRAAVVRYFRVPEQSNSKFSAILTVAARTLLSDSNLETALRRLSGLPAPLPQELFDEIDKLSVFDQRLLVRRLAKAPWSPLSQIHFLRVLLHVSQRVPRYRSVARHAFLGLCRGHKDSVDAFLNMLKWMDAESRRWPSTKPLSTAMQLGTLWGHTHEVFSAMMSADVEVAWIGRVFQEDTNLSNFLRRGNEYWTDVSNPRFLDSIAFLLSGASYVFRSTGISAADLGLAAEFRKLAFPEIDGREFPAVTMLLDPSLAGNLLDAIWATDHAEMLSVLIDSEEASKFSTSSLEQEVKNAVNSIEEGSQETVYWALIDTIMRDLPAYQSVREKLSDAIRKHDFSLAMTKDWGSGAYKLLVAARRANASNDEALRSVVAEKIQAAAVLAAGIANSDRQKVHGDGLEVSDEEAVALSLVEGALEASAYDEAVQDTLVKFARALGGIIDTWRSAGSRCRIFVRRLCTETSPSVARHFWPVLVRIRANGD